VVNASHGSFGLETLSPESIWRDLPYGGTEAPLWFYVLREAEVQQCGRRLGAVGSTIVASVILDANAASETGGDEAPAAKLRFNVGDLLAAVALGEAEAT
jgi:hypothetical protein